MSSDIEHAVGDEKSEQQSETDPEAQSVEQEKSDAGSKDHADEPETDTDDTSPFSVTHETPNSPLQEEKDVHSSIIAPSAIEKTPGAIRAGNRWLQTQWIGEFAEPPADGLLEALYSTGETRQTDISMHLDPRDTQMTLDSLEN